LIGFRYFSFLEDDHLSGDAKTEKSLYSKVFFNAHCLKMGDNFAKAQSYHCKTIFRNRPVAIAKKGV